MSEIVNFPKSSKEPASEERKRVSLDATRVVAKLALLGRLEYERARSKAAKELAFRSSTACLRISSSKATAFVREEGEHRINFHDESTVTLAWVLATAKDAKTDERNDLLLLADGNFTVSRAVPIKPERAP